MSKEQLDSSHGPQPEILDNVRNASADEIIALPTDRLGFYELHGAVLTTSFARKSEIFPDPFDGTGLDPQELC